VAPPMSMGPPSSGLSRVISVTASPVTGPCCCLAAREEPRLLLPDCASRTADILDGRVDH
jgi:hypothetical protein